MLTHHELIFFALFLNPALLVAGLFADKRLNPDIHKGTASALEYGVVASFLFHEILFFALLV